MAEPEHSISRNRLELEDLDSQMQSENIKKEDISLLKKFKKSRWQKQSSAKINRLKAEEDNFQFTEE